MTLRYVPRSYIINPKSFGKHVEAPWKPYDENNIQERIFVASSYLQHLAAIHVTSEAAARGWKTPKLYEEIPGDDTLQTFKRKLTGWAPARFDEIVAWALVVEDVTVLPAPRSLEGMMPPTKPT